MAGAVPLDADARTAPSSAHGERSSYRSLAGWKDHAQFKQVVDKLFAAEFLDAGANAGGGGGRVHVRHHDHGGGRVLLQRHLPVPQAG